MILPEWVDYKSLNEHPNVKKTIEYPQQISGDCTFKAIIMPGIIYYNLSINREHNRYIIQPQIAWQ